VPAIEFEIGSNFEIETEIIENRSSFKIVLWLLALAMVSGVAFTVGSSPKLTLQLSRRIEHAYLKVSSALGSDFFEPSKYYPSEIPIVEEVAEGRNIVVDSSAEILNSEVIESHKSEALESYNSEVIDSHNSEAVESLNSEVIETLNSETVESHNSEAVEVESLAEALNTEVVETLNSEAVHVDSSVDELSTEAVEISNIVMSLSSTIWTPLRLNFLGSGGTLSQNSLYGSLNESKDQFWFVPNGHVAISNLTFDGCKQVNQLLNKFIVGDLGSVVCGNPASIRVMSGAQEKVILNHNIQDTMLVGFSDVNECSHSVRLEINTLPSTWSEFVSSKLHGTCIYGLKIN